MSSNTPTPTTAPPPPRIYAIKVFVERHKGTYTEGAIRNLIFHAKPRKTSKGPLPSNGVEVALVRVGRKVMIDEEKFFAWAKAHSEKPGA